MNHTTPISTPHADSCPICLVDIDLQGAPHGSWINREIVWLHDIHPFHGGCLAGWFETKLHLNCPTCRREVWEDGQVALYYWRQRITRAVTKKDIQAISFIWHIKQLTSPSETQEHEILYAIQKGELTIVRLLIANDPSILTTKQGQFLRQAARNGHLDIVQFLLNDPNTLSGEDLWEAFKEAKAEQYHEVAQFLLTIGGTKSGTGCRQAIIQAAKQNNLELLQFLLQNHAALSEEDRINAAIAAIPKRFSPSLDYIDIIVLLLKDLPVITTPISTSDRERLIWTLAKSEHLSIIQALLQDGVFLSSSGWIRSIQNAAMTGRLDALKFLWEYPFVLTQPALSSFPFSEALLVATINGDLPVVQFLLEKNTFPLPAGLLDSAIACAKGENHPAIATLLSQYLPKEI